MLLGIAKKPRPILLCPGPVHISTSVLKAVINSNVGHREAEFTQILHDMREMVKPVVGIPANDKLYEVAFITGSGTAANETVLSSLGAVGPTLVISNGEFGERLYDVVKLHNPQVDTVVFNWQEPFSLSRIEEALAAKPYRLVAMVHHETSSGMLNPLSAVSRLAHKYGALISVDAISSIGAEVIKAKEWGIDVITGASGKALSAMPGVGILIVKKPALALLESATTRVHYLDLAKHFSYFRELGQTPNTPAVHVFVALHASLREITNAGLEKFRQQIANRAQYTRSQLPAMGLEFASYGRNNSSVITCIHLPEYLTFERLSSDLKQRGIVIYNGKGPLKDKIFQIGHIGALRKHDTRFALQQIAKTLVKVRPHSNNLTSQSVQVEEPIHAIQ